MAADARIETRAVLASAYTRQYRGRLLTHAVEVEDGMETRVLCGRVKLDSIADRYADDPRAVPTCLICYRRLLRIQERRTER